VAVPGPGQNSAANNFQAKIRRSWPRVTSIAFLAHRETPFMWLVAQVGRFINGRLPECRRHRGLPLIANAGAAGGRWLHQGERRGAPDRHSVRRTGYRAGLARCSAGSSGIHGRGDRWWRSAIGALNGVSPLQQDRRTAARDPHQQTVCSLKICCTPWPCPLSRLSAEGLALRRLFRSCKS
jgi:hypothetical protein